MKEFDDANKRFTKLKSDIKSRIIEWLIKPLDDSGVKLHDYTNDEIDAAAHILAVFRDKRPGRKVKMSDSDVQDGLKIMSDGFEKHVMHNQPHLRKKAAKLKEKFTHNVSKLVQEFQRMEYDSKYDR